MVAFVRAQRDMWRGVFGGTLPNGELPLDGLNAFQDYFVSAGSQTQKVDLGKVVDLSFAVYALQQLGRVN